MASYVWIRTRSYPYQIFAISIYVRVVPCILDVFLYAFAFEQGEGWRSHPGDLERVKAGGLDPNKAARAIAILTPLGDIVCHPGDVLCHLSGFHWFPCFPMCFSNSFIASFANVSLISLMARSLIFGLPCGGRGGGATQGTWRGSRPEALTPIKQLAQSQF